MSDPQDNREEQFLEEVTLWASIICALVTVLALAAVTFGGVPQ